MKNQNKAPYSIFMFLGLVCVLITSGLFLSIFKFMPKVSNFQSGLYLVSVVFSYSCLIWFILSTLGFITYKLTKTLVPASLIYSLGVLFLFLDTKIYSLYRSHLNKGLIDYAVNEAMYEIIRVGVAAVLPLVLSLLVLTLAFYFTIKFTIKKVSRNWLKKIKFVYMGALALFIATQATYAYIDMLNYIPIKKWTRHIPFYQPLTARRALLEYGVFDSDDLRHYEINQKSSDSSINYPNDIECRENKNIIKPNIVWLFIDSWRKDSFTKEITPNIYNWSRQKNIDHFENHWSIGGATIPSLFSIFYSVHGLYLKTFTESGVSPLFFKKLSKDDYKIKILTGWPLGGTTLTKSTFKEIPDLDLSIPKASDKAWKLDANINNKFLKFLKERDDDKPFFSFMIYDSAHDYSLPPDYKAPFNPYLKDLNYLSLNSNTDPKEFKNKYDNSIHYIDSLIGEVLNSDELKSLKRPTVILISSDHGEQFNDMKKNYWGHNSNFSRFQLQVPLMIQWNGVKTQANESNISYMTSHNDLVKTFLNEAFNCDLSKEQSVGYNLYSDESRVPLLTSTYSKHGILTKERIYSYEPGQGYDVYDYNYNEVEVDEIPKNIFELYLKESSRFYN